MSALLDQLQKDAITARKAHEKLSTLVLSTLLSEAKNREIELRRDLADEDVVEVVRKAMKRRREAADAFARGGRPELAEKELAEAAILGHYLPPAVDPEEIRQAVRLAIAAGATAMGPVMGKVAPQFKGRADGATISAIVKEELSSD